MKQAPFKCNKKPKIIGSASVVGGLEAQGPLKSYFDLVSRDSRFEMDTWEKAESQMLRSCVETAIKKLFWKKLFSFDLFRI